MPQYGLFTDPSGLPATIRGAIPYEIEAISPKEVWGAGNGNTSLVCRQKWDRSPTWIKSMVGEVKVIKVFSAFNSMSLRRYVPEMLQYNLAGDGTDTRIQFCTMIDQTEQGGQEEGVNMAQVVTAWPETDWCKYRATWESLPYAILDENALGILPGMSEIAAAAGANAGARELYRYVIRSRRTSSKEMTVPGANLAENMAFRAIDALRRPVPGGYAFKVLGYATISMTWVRVPIGWPPPVGYVSPGAAGFVRWPPAVNPTGAAIDPGTRRRTRDSFSGTVNDRWFDVAAPDGIAAPPGTLLYLGYDDSKKYYDAAGDWVCDITFNFIQKTGVDNAGVVGGWNHYLNATGNYIEVSADVVPGDGLGGTVLGKRPYGSNNFDDLFRWS
jgi:hypothetical protein